MSIQKEDIYETEDVSEAGVICAEENFEDSEGIEKIHVDVDSALKRFKGRMLNADQVDFSDTVKRKRCTGYGSGAYVLEVIGSEVEENETIDQKFLRLQCELNELYDAVQNQNDAETDVATASNVDCNEVMAMLETLKSMQVKNPVHEKHTSVITKSSNAPIPHKTASELNYFALESRLKQIEEATGISEVADGKYKNIRHVPAFEIMENLRMRVQLLQPAHVDGLHSRINEVLLTLKEVDKAKEEINDSELEEKIDKLYELVVKWDATCSGLPSAVRRINGLQKLHEQAQQFNEKLSQLTGIRAYLTKALESQEMAMIDFQQQTLASITKLSSDIEKLEQRIEH